MHIIERHCFETYNHAAFIDCLIIRLENKTPKECIATKGYLEVIGVSWGDTSNKNSIETNNSM